MIEAHTQTCLKMALAELKQPQTHRGGFKCLLEPKWQRIQKGDAGKLVSKKEANIKKGKDKKKQKNTNESFPKRG